MLSCKDFSCVALLIDVVLWTVHAAALRSKTVQRTNSSQDSDSIHEETPVRFQQKLLHLCRRAFMSRGGLLVRWCLLKRGVHAGCCSATESKPGQEVVERAFKAREMVPPTIQCGAAVNPRAILPMLPTSKPSIQHSLNGPSRLHGGLAVLCRGWGGFGMARYHEGQNGVGARLA